MKSPGLIVTVVLFLASCGGAAPAASQGPAGGSQGPVSSASNTAAAGSGQAGASKPAGSAPAAGAASASGAANAGGLVTLKGTFITVSPTGGPLWIGREMGIFAKNGLDVSLTSVQATAAMPALTSNDTQFASSGAAEVAALDLQGGNVEMVAEGAALPIFSLL